MKGGRDDMTHSFFLNMIFDINLNDLGDFVMFLFHLSNFFRCLIKLE